MATPPVDDKIERVLFLGKVHCYAVPPLTANKGYKAADWGIEEPTSVIFTARIRVIESSSIDGGTVKTDVRLEDPNSGELFANGPYEGNYCVIPVTDSSRFFALRVVDGARRAFLGIGFEERSDAFDFGVCLQEVRRHNNMDNEGSGPGGKPPTPGAATGGRTSYGTGRNAAIGQSSASLSAIASNDSGGILSEPPKDYSLKDGETINITIGNKGRRRPPSSPPTSSLSSIGLHSNPSGSGNNGFPLPFLPPPPSADDIKRKRQSMNGTDFSSESAFTGIAPPPSREPAGFDDEFGDFV